MTAARSTGSDPAWATQLTDAALDEILAFQILVGWAGEGLCRPKRLGWWETDLVDPDGGGDLIARLAPRTHAWAALQAVREAARQVDHKARERHGQPDRLRSLYFLGCEVDEKLADRLAVHRREGRAPAEALAFPFALDKGWDRDKVLSAFGQGGRVSFDPVPPIGRQLKGPIPSTAHEAVRGLVAALVAPADEYPFPFYRVQG